MHFNDFGQINRVGINMHQQGSSVFVVRNGKWENHQLGCNAFVLEREMERKERVQGICVL